MTSTSVATKVRFLQVNANYVGQRIDNYLLRELQGVPKSRVYRLLRKGEVRVNKGRVKADYRLQLNDQVRIPPVREAPPKAEIIIPEQLQSQFAQVILWEDKDVIIINKPAGFAVHGGSGLKFGVIDILRQIRPDLEFLELAHRLDRDTSGCLLLTKNAEALRIVQTQLRNNTMEKRYLTLVQGHWDHGEIEVVLPLEKYHIAGGEQRVMVSEHGKKAITVFKPISMFPAASLLEVQIHTGRTHQIRVHSAYLEHPIAGDDKYGERKFNKLMAKLGLKRLFLHAHSLSFMLGGRELAISAPLEDNLGQVLDKLESKSFKFK